MYALDTISFPGFCGSYEEIHGWSQSHYVDFIVKHHVNHFRFQSLFYSIYEVVFVERFQFPTNMLNESIPATNESWSFANYFSSFYLIQVLKRL